SRGAPSRPARAGPGPVPGPVPPRRTARWPCRSGRPAGSGDPRHPRTDPSRLPHADERWLRAPAGPPGVSPVGAVRPAGRRAVRGRPEPGRAGLVGHAGELAGEDAVETRRRETTPETKNPPDRSSG